MKKNQFVKFSLTVVCAAVLAACSSGGGSNNNAAAEAAAKAAAEKAAAAKAAAEKAAAEAAAKAAAEKAAADALAAERNALNDVGAKFVKKTESNLNVGEGMVTNSKSSTKIGDMTIDLHPSLDTIVVAVPLKADGSADLSRPHVYLEDFDFRGNVTNTLGEHTLTHIHKTATGATNADLARSVPATSTKTASKGAEKGLTYVYQEGRLNYTTQAVEKTKDGKTQRTDQFLQDTKSVAEVYGHRTFVKGNSETDDGFTDTVKTKNLPLAVKDASGKYTQGGMLNYVQYGRVTTKLDKIDLAALKDGKPVVSMGTKVGSFGEYGSVGTENHYFYRGVNGLDLAKMGGVSYLQGKYFAPKATGGVLNYRGHAVTYNLDRPLSNLNGLPNAIGYEQTLVSGTHVNANIDLATKAVTGNLYNVWEFGYKGGAQTESEVELAKFNGTLYDNGSITGTSTRTVDSASGKFTASLFGSLGEELGGAIVSNNTTNSWGASFGAKTTNALYKAPSVTPTPGVAGLGEANDGRDKNVSINTTKP